MNKNMTQERLKEILIYDEATGLFVWNTNISNLKKGDPAGYRSKRGYVFIRADNGLYLAHRLAWLYMTGEFPGDKLDIDHINQVKFDNRFSNLRLASRSENMMNTGTRSDNKTGYKGVFFVKRLDKYMASIRVNYKSKHLGLFDTPEEASKAYILSAKRSHGSFVPDGVAV